MTNHHSTLKPKTQAAYPWFAQNYGRGRLAAYVTSLVHAYQQAQLTDDWAQIDDTASHIPTVSSKASDFGDSN